VGSGAMSGWVKVVSWHLERPGDQRRTLCGLDVRAHPEPGEHKATGWSAQLPPNQKSCENCLRMQARDQGK
jgi:hypothetical protein